MVGERGAKGPTRAAGRSSDLQMAVQSVYSVPFLHGALTRSLLPRSLVSTPFLPHLLLTTQSDYITHQYHHAMRLIIAHPLRLFLRANAVFNFLSLSAHRHTACLARPARL